MNPIYRKVRVEIFFFCKRSIRLTTVMSAIATMEVVTTTVKTQKEVILAPVIMATNLTMMDILVKVCKLY